MFNPLLLYIDFMTRFSTLSAIKDISLLLQNISNDSLNSIKTISSAKNLHKQIKTKYIYLLHVLNDILINIDKVKIIPCNQKI